jgi:hypothetical protein
LSDWGPNSGLNFYIHPLETGEDTLGPEGQFYAFDQNVPSRRPKLFIEIDSNEINGLKEAVVDEISVYPNPCDGRLYIKSSEPVAAYSLFDVQGKCIQEKQSVGIDQVDWKHAKPGVYVLHLRTGTSIASKRVVVR